MRPDQMDLMNTRDLPSNRITGTPRQRPAQNNGGGVFWRGQDGKVYVSGHQGTNAAGDWNGSTAAYWGSRGFREIPDPNPITPGNPTNDDDIGRYGTAAAERPKLDQAQIDSLMAQLGLWDTNRANAHRRARITRDEQRNTKNRELEKEEKNYKGRKLSNLQDFGSAKTDTDINTRDTLENLVSSISTMGLAGSDALTRQILGAANRSNRQANATQAQNAMELTGAFNDYKAGYNDDMKKISDQYNFNTGEADRQWGQDRQNTLFKIADTYNAADRDAERQNFMSQGNSLNATIGNSAFLNPKYTGQSRAMKTPEMADYMQDIARYNTTGLGGGEAQGGNGGQGNLAMRAVAVNDRDFGVKKRNENDLGYGV